jgi:hypothetical protein
VVPLLSEMQKNKGFKMSADLSDMKIGDTVFVVPQKQRDSPQPDGFRATIIAVGRKYATCQVGTQWKRDYRFDRKTGRSVHDVNHNARSNGLGWDVYRDESEYQTRLHESNRLASLIARLDAGYRSCVKNLPPHAVEQIHGILDEHK